MLAGVTTYTAGGGSSLPTKRWFMSAVTGPTTTSSARFCKRKLVEAGAMYSENKRQGTEPSEKFGSRNCFHGLRRKLSVASGKPQRAFFINTAGSVLPGHTLQAI